MKGLFIYIVLVTFILGLPMFMGLIHIEHMVKDIHEEVCEDD